MVLGVKSQAWCNTNLGLERGHCFCVGKKKITKIIPPFFWRIRREKDRAFQGVQSYSDFIRLDSPVDHMSKNSHSELVSLE